MERPLSPTYCGNKVSRDCKEQADAKIRCTGYRAIICPIELVSKQIKEW